MFFRLSNPRWLARLIWAVRRQSASSHHDPAARERVSDKTLGVVANVWPRPSRIASGAGNDLQETEDDMPDAGFMRWICQQVGVAVRVLISATIAIESGNLRARIRRIRISSKVAVECHILVALAVQSPRWLARLIWAVRRQSASSHHDPAARERVSDKTLGVVACC